MTRGQRRDDLDHEHDRVLDQRAWIELDECRAESRDEDLGVGQRRHAACRSVEVPWGLTPS